MSNLKLILLVAVAFFLVIYFGHDPMDEVRKKRAERIGKSLVQKIEEANKKGDMPPGFNSNLSSQPFNNGGMQNRNGQNPFQSANPYNQQQMNQAPGAPKGAGGQPGVPGNQPPPQDNYYPPEPKNKQIVPPISSLPDSKGTIIAKKSPLPDSKATIIAKKALTNPNLITDDGKNLAFWGTKVYVYDNIHDKFKPMPDGNYPMYDGEWTMMVRGGEQVIAEGEGLSW